MIGVEEAIKKMVEIGFFDILGFALFSAIFYAILRKMKVLGDSALIHGIIALSIGFFIFGYPVLVGARSLTRYLSLFFVQASSILLVFLLAFLLASFFYPNLISWLPTVFQRRTTLWALIGLAFALFITSGLISVLWNALTTTSSTGTEKTPPRDILIFIAGIVIFVVMLMIAASVVKGG